jgi:DNA processing protein
VIPHVTEPAYVYALNQVEGIRLDALLFILNRFPTRDSLLEATSEMICDKLGEELSRIVLIRLLDHWEIAYSAAQNIVERHLEKNVVPVAITEPTYPPLLKLIPDPPPLLFVKGDLETLSSANTVAIVGTRDATDGGKEVARRVAKFFGKNGYVIVSGLAKGIDTAAHAASIDEQAKTVAVLGTPLDQIYPAENKSLAECIATQSGALATELELGRKSFRNAFVRRDRIQSGMSLAVIPVQTDIHGGTMHTVNFAEIQGRLLFCPKPLASEHGLKQYAGVSELIRSHKAREFQAEDYESLVELLAQCKEKLLSIDLSPIGLPMGVGAPEVARVGHAKERKTALEIVQPTLGFVEPTSELEQPVSDDEIERLVEAIHQIGLDVSRRRFNEAVTQVRKRLFGRGKPKSKTTTGRPVPSK